MDKTKAQDCPLCGNEAKEQKDVLYEGEGTHHCSLMNCVFSMQWYPLGVWNRIRIAPNDEDVKLREIDIAGVSIDVLEQQDWMNPRYPDETKEGE